MKSENRNISIKRIENTALSLFIKNGFDRTTIRMIAEKAEISIGLLYNYYSSKESLLSALFTEGLGQIKDSFTQESDTLPPSEMIENLIRNYFEMIREDNKFWKLYYIIRTQPSVLKGIEMKGTGWINYLHDQFETYFELTNEKNPKAQARILFAAIDGIAQHYVLSPTFYPIEEATETIIKKFCRD